VRSGDWATISAGGKKLRDWVTAMTDGDRDVWTDTLATSRYRCTGTDEASCTSVAGCSAMSGSEKQGAPAVFEGCSDDGANCSATHECAISPEADRCARFTGRCFPNGWAEAPCDFAGCPENPVVARSADCTMETVTAYVIDGQAVTDCGDLPSDAAPDQVAQARDCVVAAQDAKEPYRVTWVVSANDVFIQEGASVGHLAGDAYAVYQFDYESDTGQSAVKPPFATWTTCGTTASPTCAANDPLCLGCVPVTATECNCGPQSLSTDIGINCRVHPPL
jgi:hypothetical protein